MIVYLDNPIDSTKKLLDLIVNLAKQWNTKSISEIEGIFVH